MALKEQLKEKRIFSVHDFSDFNASKAGSTDSQHVARHREAKDSYQHGSQERKGPGTGMLCTHFLHASPSLNISISSL